MSTSIDELMKRVKTVRTEAWQYLEVKQLSEILTRHREKARKALRELRLHRLAQRDEKDPVERLYMGYEGVFMRDHLRDALRLYLMINHDYHEACRSYMADLNNPVDEILPPELLLDNGIANALPGHRKMV